MDTNTNLFLIVASMLLKPWRRAWESRKDMEKAEHALELHRQTVASYITASATMDDIDDTRGWERCGTLADRIFRLDQRALKLETERDAAEQAIANVKPWLAALYHREAGFCSVEERDKAIDAAWNAIVKYQQVFRAALALAAPLATKPPADTKETP